MCVIVSDWMILCRCNVVLVKIEDNLKIYKHNQRLEFLKSMFTSFRTCKKCIINPKSQTAWIVTKYYLENASSAIALSREHLYVHQNAGRAATHGGLACRVTGLVCERSADRNPGSYHIIAHPISRQIGFSGSGVRVNRQKCKTLFNQGMAGSMKLPI